MLRSSNITGILRCILDSDAQVVVDPNEPRYCHCQQVAFGEMIACDNPDVSCLLESHMRCFPSSALALTYGDCCDCVPQCKIEWFHFGCVGLTRRPQNAWFCPTCSEKTKKSRHAGRGHR